MTHATLASEKMRITVPSGSVIFDGCVPFTAGVLTGIWVCGIAGPLTDDGETISYDFTPNRRDVRREVSIAVEQAIVRPSKRVTLALRAAVGEFEPASGIGRSLLRARYRGDLKQRRAMRRLLRATGATRLQ